jgi:hypothetical protein
MLVAAWFCTESAKFERAADVNTLVFSVSQRVSRFVPTAG